MAATGGAPTPVANTLNPPAANPSPNPITTAPAYTAEPDTPAMMALPVQPAVGNDGSTSRKFYTISASLRETYDDNVTTASNNKHTSLDTNISPSLLVDFPFPDGDFSARYTFGMTYYTHGPNVSSTGEDPAALDLSHEFVAQFTHSFSNRFNLNVAERFRDYTEPSLYQGTGTFYQNGPYISNTVNGTLNAQWTPLVGTTTTYSNTVVRYDEAAVAQYQNNVENTGTQSFSFAIYPKISLTVGGIVDVIDYDINYRGYSNYTLFGGVQWEALPTLNVTARLGGSYTVPALGEATFGPYAALTVNWTLGAKSRLAFNYAHEITPSDEFQTSAQESDQFSANFSYDLTPRLTTAVEGLFTASTVSSSLITSGSGISGYSENDYALDMGLTFHYNSYLDLDGGVSVSGVTSDLAFRKYNRDQVYIGVRGTY
jgi:hypothetical protein